MNSQYTEVFSEGYDLRMYPAALALCKNVEAEIIRGALCDEPYEARSYATMFRFLYAHLYAAAKTSRRVRNDQQIIELARGEFDRGCLADIHNVVVALRRELKRSGRSLKKLHRSEQFTRDASDQVLRFFAEREPA